MVQNRDMGSMVFRRLGLMVVALAVGVAQLAPPGTVKGSDGTIPDGTVLRIGDQFGVLGAVMALSGASEGVPYELEFATMVPGPAQLHALQSGDIDAGSLSALALIQAGAGGLDVAGIARWRTDFALSALVTAPGVIDVGGWGDLRGRRVAFQRGTTAEAVVLLALDEVGLTVDDIDVVDVSQLQLGAVLQQGHADVAVLSEPFAGQYLEENPSASYVLGVDGAVGQSSLIAASTDALEDSAKAAALGDFVARLDGALRRLTADRGDFADLVVEVWGLDREHVESVLIDSEGVEMGDVPGDLLAPLERLVALLAVSGDVPATLDPRELFDDRFNTALS